MPSYLLIAHSAIDYLATETDHARFESTDIDRPARDELLAMYRYDVRPGGVAANVAPLLARSKGNTVAVQTVFGSESPYAEYSASIGKFGVDFGRSRVIEGKRMSECFVITCGDRQKIRWFDNAAGDFLKILGEAGTFAGFDVLFLSIMDPEVAYRAAGSFPGKLVYNAGQYIGRLSFADTHFADIAPGASVIALNEREEEIVVREMGLRTVRALFDFETVDVLVVTRSRFGSTVHTRNSSSTYFPAAPVKAVDPTGAGDAFLATFCDCFFRGYPPSAAQRAASCAAETVVCRIGSALEDVSF